MTKAKKRAPTRTNSRCCFQIVIILLVTLLSAELALARNINQPNVANKSKTGLQLRGGASSNKVTTKSDSNKTNQRKTNAVSPRKPALSRIDIGAFGIYFCTAVTMTLPVLIVPMMDVDLQQLGESAINPTQALSKQALSLAATVASMAPMGGGVGKIVNGFVCQLMGAPKSSKLYFVGSTLFALGLASTSLSSSSSEANTLISKLLAPNSVGWMVAGIEFCASIQWTVCSLFLSQYYASQPTLFARGVTIMSLASTSGQISSKVIGAFLLQFYLDWRQLSIGMCWVAVAGFGISTWTSMSMPSSNIASAAVTRSLKAPSSKAGKQNTNSLRYAMSRVLGSRMFWLIGLAHVAGYLTRTSDRVIGSFLQEITSLSPQFCGGLTAFITVGFVYGLMTSSKQFYQQSATVESKLRLLKLGYIRVVACVGGLALSAAFGGKAWVNPYACAIFITICGSIMAASISFPFFQMPNMVSSIYFPDVKPVALSLIDGTGFFLTSPIWKVFTRNLLPKYGWAVSWSLVAVLVATCGSIMMTTVPEILEMQQPSQPRKR